jgi:hypothetical protein
MEKNTMYERSTCRLSGYSSSALLFRFFKFGILFFLISAVQTGGVFSPGPDAVFSQTLKIANTLAQLQSLRLQSNSITDIRILDPYIWLGTGSGLQVTSDKGLTFSNFSNNPGMASGSISAIDIQDGVIWVATAFDTVVNEDSFSAGGGLSWSDNGGLKWNFIDQPVDPNDPEGLGYQPTTTNIQNVTFDLALTDNTIWIASWGGGLRKTVDNGQTWTVVTPDGLPFDVLTNLNHRTFTVIDAANGLWAGTAQGINKSTDGGQTWTQYTAQNGSGISGNFITQLAEQITSEGSIIWAATWQAEDPNEFFAVSRTMNNGLTWNTMLEGEKVHNFGFDGDAVFIVSDNGLFKSPDMGNTWGLYPQITASDGKKILTTEYFDVKAENGTIWVGTKDGLGKSFDNGLEWDIFRAFPQPGIDGEPEVYAYPNPFSPLRQNRFGGEGFVRIQYRTFSETVVSVDIFDFTMNTVKNVVSNQPRPLPGDYAELWDGTNNWGVMVANGVYFFRLQARSHKTVWGKLIIMN